MDLKLEVIGIPVSDVDQAIAFYTERLGFVLDHDAQPGNGMRVVQLTPPGSACSIVFGTGLPLSEPGSTKGLQLVVDDIDAVREMFADRGVGPGRIDGQPLHLPHPADAAMQLGVAQRFETSRKCAHQDSTPVLADMDARAVARP